MYRCSVCKSSTRPYQTRLLRVTRRTIQDPVTGMTRCETEKEEPVCPSCAERLGLELAGAFSVKSNPPSRAESDNGSLNQHE